MRFIVISVPADALSRRIRKLQKILSSSTGAKEALRYPPHVTLRTGMICPDEAAAEAVHGFLAHARLLGGAAIACDAALASSYRDAAGTERGFLGYPVALTEELRELHSGLLAYEPWRKGLQGVFEPHVSLCYHDITSSAAGDLLAEHRPAIEALDPAWRVGAVELWAQAGESWIFHARAELR